MVEMPIAEIDYAVLHANIERGDIVGKCNGKVLERKNNVVLAQVSPTIENCSVCRLSIFCSKSAEERQ